MRTAFLLILSLALAGCSFLTDFDDLRGAPDGSVEVQGAPLATIDFPPAGRTGAHSVTVRGSVMDVEGDEITEVRVNGALAAVDPSGTWSVNVQLAYGENVLAVRTADSSGAATDSAASVTVERQPILRGAVDMDLDAANGRLLVLTGGLLGAVDLDDMEIHAVSDAARGSGHPLRLAGEIALDAGAQTVVVSSLMPPETGWTFAAVDVASGDRSVYSGESVGSGDPVGGIKDLVVDAANDRVVVSTYSGLMTVDRSDRARQSVPIPGGNPTIGALGDVTLDAMAGTVLVVNYDNLVPSILRVNVADGVRTVFSGTGAGSGPAMKDEVRMVLDPANGRVLAVSGVDDGSGGTDFVLMQIAIDDGAREILSGPGLGDGPALAAAGPVVFDAPRGRALVLDATLEQIIAIDLENGDRTVALDLGSAADSGGVPECFAFGVALEPAGSRALSTCLGGIVAGLSSWVAATNLETGARSVLSGTGAGEAVDLLYAIDVDVDNARALAADANLDTIFAVNLTTGVRAIASGPGAEFGLSLAGPKDIAVDAERERALVVTDRVLSMSLATGFRTEMSGPTEGFGEPFRNPFGIAVDGPNARAIVIDSCDPSDDACVRARLLAVSFATGERTIHSDSTHGDGPDFENLVTIAMDGDRVLVGDATLRAVFSVDRLGGDRTILARPGLETGVPILVPTLLSAGGIDVDPARPWAVLADPTLGLIAMDRVTGETIALGF